MCSTTSISTARRRVADTSWVTESALEGGVEMLEDRVDGHGDLGLLVVEVEQATGFANGVALLHHEIHEPAA
jgi:hypothetical protein